MPREYEEKHVGLASLYTSCWQAEVGWAETHSNRKLAPEVTIPGGEKAQGRGFLQGWDRGKVRGVQEKQASFLYLNVNLVRTLSVPSSLPVPVLLRTEANTFQLPKLTLVLHLLHAWAP